MKKYLLLILFIIYGCASKNAMNPEKILDNIPEDWATNVTSSLSVSEIWWEEFQDENLNNFLKQFLLENINLEQAMINTRIAKQASVISTSNLFPSIYVGASASEAEQNTAGFPPLLRNLFGVIEQSNNPELDPTDPSLSEVSTFNQKSYSLSLNTQWEIDLWGKIRQGRLAGKQQYLSSKYNYSYYQLSLTAEAAKLYFMLIEAKDLTQNAQKKYDNSKIIFDLYSMRYKKGTLPFEAFKQSELIVNLAESDLENRKSILSTLTREAKVLIKEYPNLNLDISESFPSSIPNIPDIIPSDIIKRRPDLIASQYNLLASEALDRQAMRSLYPSFSLVGSSGASSDVKDLLNDDYSVWSAGLNLLSPIFNGGKLIANKKIARNNKEIAMLSFVNNLLNAYKEVETSLELDQTTQLSLQLLTDNVKLHQQIYDNTFSKFEKGIATFEDVINANNALYESKNMLTNNEKVRIEQRINLILSLGGGFKYKE